MTLSTDQAGQPNDPADPLPPKARVEALISLFNSNQIAAVIAEGEVLSRSYPRAVVVWEILGAAHLAMQRVEPAIACFRRIIEIDTANAEAQNNLGALLQHAGRPDEAISGFEKAIALKPDYAEAHFNLGGTLQDVGRHQDALGHLEATVRLRPGFSDALVKLGAALMALGRTNEAIVRYGEALQTQPDNAELRNDLGAALRDVGRVEEAIVCLTRATAIRPDYADASYNLGNALRDVGRLDEAAERLARSVRLDPAVAEAQSALGGVLKDLGRYDEAAACYARAVEIDPLYAEAQAQKAFVLSTICDWRTPVIDPAALPALERSAGAVSPFFMLALDDNPARHRERAERFAAERYGQRAPEPFAKRGGRPGPLRIGYFSADFHGHATAYLIARLFELHDPARFSLHAYSFGPDSGDAMRARLERSVEAFHDVRTLSDQDVSALARRDGIDIAVDLKGYTAQARPGVFACRAAPIQISYLGYPGTMGAPFIDYIVADRTVIPPDDARHYSENIIYLPDSYQVNDDRRVISDRPVTRSEMGLPEQGFVFCCFNNTYKISPAVFDIWMRLLQRISGSVLWLYGDNAWARANLRTEAAARGIDPDRLVFAGRLPLADHLARHRLADLFLDTLIYNAHTTASDALWAGLPVLTKPGQGFAARVAASLLTAVDLSELIAPSLEAYEALAIDLATHRDKLDDIRARLAASRLSAPLFDTERFAKHIENAYAQAHERYVSGLGPGLIEVA